MAIVLQDPEFVWVAECPRHPGITHVRDSETMWDLGGQYHGQPEDHPTHGFQCVEGQANCVGRPVNYRKVPFTPPVIPPRRRQVRLNPAPTDSHPERRTMDLDPLVEDYAARRVISVIQPYAGFPRYDDSDDLDQWEAALVIGGELSDDPNHMWRGADPFEATRRLIAHLTEQGELS